MHTGSCLCGAVSFTVARALKPPDACHWPTDTHVHDHIFTADKGDYYGRHRRRRAAVPADPAMIVGVISDTHGLVRPEALAALVGVEHIVHAGDIGNDAVLDALRAIAPVTAVRGNNDKGSPLPETAMVTLGRCTLYVVHDVHELDLDPRAAGIDVVISGHSHKPVHQVRNGVLYLNPGSAGPRRFKLPIALARLQLPELTVEMRLLGDA